MASSRDDKIDRATFARQAVIYLRLLLEKVEVDEDAISPPFNRYVMND